MARSDRMYADSPRMERGEDGNIGVTKPSDADKENMGLAGNPTEGNPGEMDIATAHSQERADMHKRHETELSDMHSRHEEEHKKMHKRHHEMLHGKEEKKEEKKPEASKKEKE